MIAPEYVVLVVWLTVKGGPEEVVARYGQDAQLIVVGARGLSTVRSVVLGGVSNALVHHAKRPVLVVPKLS